MASLSTLPSAEDAAVAVAGVLAAADVGDEQQIGCRARSRRSARCTMPSSAKFSDPISSFAAGRPKRRTRGDAERPDPVDLPVERLVHREVADPGHRGDLALDPGAVDHEKRLDQVAGRELVLAHEAAQGVGAPPAPWAMDLGGGHGGKTREPAGSPQPRTASHREAPGMTFAASSAGGRGHGVLLASESPRDHPVRSHLVAGIGQFAAPPVGAGCSRQDGAGCP